MEEVAVEMETEAEAPEVEEVEAPAEDEAHEADDAEPVDGDGDADDGEGEQDEPEEVEIDFGGSKRAFKKNATVAEIHGELQDYAKSLYSDYINKTQTVAEQRKAVQAQVQDLEVLGQVSQEYHLTLGRALTAQSEIQQLRQVDLNALWNSNPDQARRVSDLIRQKEAEALGLADQLQKAEDGVKKAKAEGLERIKAEGKARIEKAIPEFSTRHVNSVIDYIAQNYAISKEEAEAQWAAAPDVTIMAWKAMKYDQAAKAAKRPAQKTVSKPVSPKAARPAPRVVEASSPQSDQMSTEKWLELRNKQLAAKRRA